MKIRDRNKMILLEVLSGIFVADMVAELKAAKQSAMQDPVCLALMMVHALVRQMQVPDQGGTSKSMKKHLKKHGLLVRKFKAKIEKLLKPSKGDQR